MADRLRILLAAAAMAGVACLWIGAKASQSVSVCRQGYRKLARKLIQHQGRASPASEPGPERPDAGSWGLARLR